MKTTPLRVKKQEHVMRAPVTTNLGRGPGAGPRLSELNCDAGMGDAFAAGDHGVRMHASGAGDPSELQVADRRTWRR
ncbi:MAG: hypothetical protein ACJ73J_12310 [Actinomycetes bacterium]